MTHARASHDLGWLARMRRGVLGALHVTTKHLSVSPGGEECVRRRSRLRLQELEIEEAREFIHEPGAVAKMLLEKRVVGFRDRKMRDEDEHGAPEGCARRDGERRRLVALFHT